MPKKKVVPEEIPPAKEGAVLDQEAETQVEENGGEHLALGEGLSVAQTEEHSVEDPFPAELPVEDHSADGPTDAGEGLGSCDQEHTPGHADTANAETIVIDPSQTHTDPVPGDTPSQDLEHAPVVQGEGQTLGAADGAVPLLIQGETPVEGENPPVPEPVTQSEEDAAARAAAQPGALDAEDGGHNPTRKDEPEQAQAGEGPADGGDGRPVSHRDAFFDLKFNELDRWLSPEERQEWNSIYASYRSRSNLTGTVIGMDEHSFNIKNKDTGEMERRTIQCAIVISYRVKVLIPETEMWFGPAEARPDFVLRNMVGADIDYVILQVDREGGVAVASRRMALGARRYQLSRLTSLHRPDALTKCKVLAVGPRRCLVECHGYDIGLTQREMRYTAIPDLRDEYHPGDELDCRIKFYDAEKGELEISIKEVHPHPFEGAELRHPVGSRRQAVIAGKYGGGVFCNLPDGTVCMSLYSSRHDDADFKIGDKVIIVIRQYDNAKKQIYGKIISKW